MKNVIGVILISFFFFSCQSNQEGEKGLLRYKIDKKQKITSSRMIYRIIIKVDKIPSDDAIKRTATHIWENGNKNWTEFTVSLYLPEMELNYSAYSIIEFNTKGITDFSTSESNFYGTKWEKKENTLSDTNLEIKKHEKTIKQTSTAELKEYKIDISINNIEKRKIEIIINTNFPDGTNLSVDIGRTHFLKGREDAYSGNLFSKDFSVENGEFKTTSEINDSEWYNEHIRLVKAIPDDIQPIAKISDNITIDVLYTSAANQPMKVINILGAKGEFVTGEGIKKYKGETIGLLTALRTSKEFYLPFEKQLSINKSQTIKKELLISLQSSNNFQGV